MTRQSIVGKVVWLVGLSAAVLVLAGCSSGEPQSGAYRDGSEADSSLPSAEVDQGEVAGQGVSGISESAGTADVDSESEGVEPDSADAVSQDDVVVFLAAGERMLKGTAYSGVLHESPEVYVTAAQLICERLSAGDSVDEVVSDFITDASLSLSVDADITLAGTVLGAGVETLCPTNRDLL